MMKSLFPVVILAGGLATRLRPMTTHIPKGLIDINKEPFIAHQLRLLHRRGVCQVLICIGHLGEQIKNFVGKGERFNLQVQYSSDWPDLLGTAGAIKKALPLIHGNTFFVIYGDSYLPCDYKAVQKKFMVSKKMGLMAVFKNNNCWDQSNIELVNNKIVCYDKENYHENMHYIDYGLGVFNRSVFEKLMSEQYDDLANIYQRLLRKDQLAAYSVSTRFYEIGSLRGQQELAAYLQI